MVILIKISKTVSLKNKVLLFQNKVMENTFKIKPFEYKLNGGNFIRIDTELKQRPRTYILDSQSIKQL